MEENKERLTEEEVDQKIAEAKERIKQHATKYTKVVQGGTPEFTLQMYKAKKERARKRAKVQKASKKVNRKKK